MVRDACRPDGYTTICRSCKRARQATRQADATYRNAKNAAKRERCKDPTVRKVLNAAERERCKDPAVREAKRAADRDRMRRNAARTRDQVEAWRAEHRPDGLQRCRRCRFSLPFAAFSADATQASGLRAVCRACGKARLLRRALPSWEDRDIWQCVHCAAPFEHVDHVWPSKHGGPDHACNLVPACEQCNTSKGARHVLDWIAERDPEIYARVMSPAFEWHVINLDDD
jgi:5-methylcytosine-specific restriction endonuclease McrA